MINASYQDLVNIYGPQVARNTVHSMESVARIDNGKVIPFNYQKRFQKAFEVLIETNYAIGGL